MKEKLVNVGIFWAVPNKWEGGWSFYEVKKTYQLSDANSLGFIDYPYSHYEKWDDVRSASETDDCYYYPRGRVLYNVNTGKYRIFADECLDECDLWELIEMFEIEDFELCRDEHYVSVFTQKHKTAVTPMLEQAILIKGERSMETNFETVFTTRLIQIVGAKASQLDDDAKMPNRAYDLFRRFTSKEDGANDLKKFAIMNGIWQEYLVKSVCKYDINFFEATQVIGRRKDIFKVNRQHDAQTDKTGTVEKRNCHWFCKNQQDKFPQIILYDREVPIVKQKTDREGATVDIVCTDNKPKPGKIDLVGADNDEMVIIEYKIASSPEPLLRAVAEIITYFHQIGGKNGATTYLEQFNKTFGLNCKKVGMAVAVPEIMYKAAHRYAFDLIQKYNIRCYSVDARSADEPETLASEPRTKEFTYTVSESGSVKGVENDTNSYEVTYTVTDNGDGTISVVKSTVGQQNDFTFTNTYRVDPKDSTLTGDGNLTITKTLIGSDEEAYVRDLVEGEFAFELVDTEGNLAASGSNDAEGNVELSSVTFKEPGTYLYTLREAAGEAGGVDYDTTSYAVKAIVTDNRDGTLGVAWTTSDGTDNVENAQFTNVYRVNPTSVTLSAGKFLVDPDGKALDIKDGQFAFELKNSDGETFRKNAEVTANGTASFDAIEFTKPGTYVYTISEVNDGQEGMTYDESVYTATITVTDDGAGNLNASVAYTLDGDEVASPVFTNTYTEPAQPEVKPEDPKDTIPATGDHALVSAAAIAVAAATVLGLGVATSRKRGE